MTCWCRNCGSMFRVGVAYGSVPAFCSACDRQPGLPTVPADHIETPKPKKRRKSRGFNPLR